MAAGRDMKARLLLLLQDNGLGAKLDAITGKLSHLGSTARRIGAMGAILGGLSFAGPVQAATQFHDMLLQTQITAGQVGPAAHAAAAEAARAFERLALETGQRSADLGKAAGNLVAAGLNPEEMLAFMPVLARTATATGASVEDLSRTAVALRQNLNITSAGDLADALGSMTAAGKAGMFELRDMAREFPSLTAAAQALGLTGRDAVTSLSAMLQVARQGAGTSSEAANNLANFLQKMTSPETVKNFREMGVNLQAVLADAGRQGINPIEAVLQKIRERTGGDMFKVGELFGDRQVLDFIRPMLRGTQQYLDILDGARRANAALINQDFGTRMAGAALSLAKVQEMGEQLLRRIGLAAAANLGPVEQFLGGVMRGVAWLDAHYPGVVDKTVAWVAGLALLAGALGVLAPVFGAIAAGIGILLSPFVLLTAAIAGVTWAIYDWEGFSAFFNGLWDEVKGIFSGVAGWLDEWSGGRLGGIVAAIQSAWSVLTGFFGALWDGIQARFDAFLGWVEAAFAPIRRIIDAVNTGIGRAGQQAEPGPAQGQANARMANRAQRIEGWDAPVAGGAGGTGRAQLEGELRIGLAPGLVLERAGTDQPGLAVTGSQGAFLGRD